MQETETIVAKYTKDPPKTPVEVAKCLGKIYEIVPRITASRFDPAKTIALRDALFVTMCDYYCELTERVMVDDDNFLTPACGVFVACAALTLVSGEKYDACYPPNGLIGQLGLLPSVKSAETHELTLVELVDAVWLLSMRMNQMHICAVEPLSELMDYVKSLILRAFFFIQTELEMAEIPPKLAKFVEKSEPGQIKATPRLIRRLCEGLCRPLAILRLFLVHFSVEEIDQVPHDKVRALREMCQQTTPDYVTVDTFQEQIRDFIEIGSVSPVDYASYVDVARADKYIPHMMLTLSRPSQFLARRAWYVGALPIRRLIDFDESDPRALAKTHVTDRLGALAVKMYAVNACLEPAGISVICDYLIMEPFLQNKIHVAARKKEPYFIMAFGMIHVLFNEKIFLCPLGFEQAVCVWAELVLSQTRAMLLGKNVAKQIAKLFESKKTNLTIPKFAWETQVQI